MRTGRKEQSEGFTLMEIAFMNELYQLEEIFNKWINELFYLLSSSQPLTAIFPS